MEIESKGTGRAVKYTTMSTSRELIETFLRDHGHKFDDDIRETMLEVLEEDVKLMEDYRENLKTAILTKSKRKTLERDLKGKEDELYAAVQKAIENYLNPPQLTIYANAIDSPARRVMISTASLLLENGIKSSGVLGAVLLYERLSKKGIDYCAATGFIQREGEEEEIRIVLFMLDKGEFLDMEYFMMGSPVLAYRSFETRLNYVPESHKELKRFGDWLATSDITNSPQWLEENDKEGYEIYKRLTVVRDCTGCGEACYKTFICAGCKTARYCGKECQKQDWKQHKKSCS